MFTSIGRYDDPELWLRRLAAALAILGALGSACATVVLYKGVRWAIALVTVVFSVLCAGRPRPLEVHLVEIALEEPEEAPLIEREPVGDDFEEAVTEQDVAAADAEWMRMQEEAEAAEASREAAGELVRSVGLLALLGVGEGESMGSLFGDEAFVGGSFGGIEGGFGEDYGFGGLGGVGGLGTTGGLGSRGSGLGGGGTADGIGGLGTSGRVGRIHSSSPDRETTPAALDASSPPDVPPRIAKQEKVELSEAVRQRLDGPTSCEVTVALDALGAVVRLDFGPCPLAVRQAVSEAARDSRYKPAKRDGEAVAGSLVVVWQIAP